MAISAVTKIPTLIDLLIPECVKQARELTPKEPGTYDGSYQSLEKIEQLEKCARHWQACAEALPNSSFKVEECNSFSLFVICDNAPLSIEELSLRCFLSASKVRVSQIMHMKMFNTDPGWRNLLPLVDGCLEEIIKNANLLEISTDAKPRKIEIKELKIQAMHEKSSLKLILDTHKYLYSDVEVDPRMYSEEREIAGLYQELIDLPQIGKWNLLFYKARHLMQAGLIAPSQEEKVSNLKEAEEIIQDICKNCKEIIQYPDYSKRRMTSRESSLLEEIRDHLRACL